VAAGRLHPVYAEVYSLGGPPQTDLELWMAATLTYGPMTRLSASAGAELRGWLRYPLREIHVVTLRKRLSRDGITAHHRPRYQRYEIIGGIRTTTVEQTVLDCATVVASDKAYRRIVRQAQVDDLTSHAALLAFATMNKGARGVARLKHELADGPSRTRSATEDEILELFRKGGQPIPNAIVHGREFDLYFPSLDVAVEVMSGLHDNPTAHADDEAKKLHAEARGTKVLWIR
jgi:hypothetical protein